MSSITSRLPTRFVILLLLTPIVFLYSLITGDRSLWRKWRRLLRKSFPWPKRS